MQPERGQPEPSSKLSVRRYLRPVFYVGVFLLFGWFLFGPTEHASAATCTSITSGSGNWNATGSWTGCTGGNGTPANTPGPADTAIISTTANITVTSSITVSALTFNTLCTNCTVTVNNGVTLTVTNAITVQSLESATGRVATITGSGAVTAGSMTVGSTITPSGSRTTTLNLTVTSLTVNGAIGTTCSDGASGSRRNDPTISLQSGTLTTSGTITLCNGANANTSGRATFTMAGGAQSGTLVTSAATPWTVGAGGLATTTLSGTTATVNYSGANQAVRVTNYENLTLSGSGTATGAVTTIGGSFTMSGTVAYSTAATLAITDNLVVGASNTLTLGNFAITVSGTTNVSGTVTTATGATGTRTFTGAVTVNSGATWNLSGQNPATTFTGGITMNGTTFNNGSGTATLNGSQAFAGSSNMTFGGVVAISGAVTVTNNNTGTVTVSGNITGTVSGSTWTQGASSNMSFAGSTLLATGTFNASASGNTVTYSGTTQTGKAVAYHNLVLSNSGVKTLAGDSDIAGTFTMSGTSSINVGTDGSVGIMGDWNINTTAATPFAYTSSAGVYVGGSGTQTIGGITTATLDLYYIQIDDTNAVLNLNENVTLTGIKNNGTVIPASGVTIGGTSTPPISCDVGSTCTFKVTRTSATADFNSQYPLFDNTYADGAYIIPTIDYAGTGQTVNNYSYKSLIISGTVTGSSTFTSGYAAGPVEGTMVVTGTFTPSNGTVTYIQGWTFTNNGTTEFVNLVGSCSSTTLINISTSFDIVVSLTNGSNCNFAPTTGTITIHSSGVISNSGTLSFYNLSTLCAFGSLAFTANTNFTVQGNFTVGTGCTFEPSSGTYTLRGNFTNNGIFTASGTHTVALAGTATQTFSGATTFNNFSVTGIGAAKTIQFEAGTIFTFAGASNSFTVTGSSGNLITITSTTTARWLAHFNNAQPSSVTYVNLQHSGCDTGTASVTLDGTSTNDATATINDSTCWVFGTFITVSGTIYGTDESTAITTGPTIKLSVNGGTASSTTANGSGVFSFSGIASPSASDIITIWIDGATEDGTLVFRYGTSCTGNPDCTGLSIFRDMVILDSKDGSAITNANLAACDNDTGCADAEIGFTSESGTLSLSTGRTLRIKDATSTFTPGGVVTANFFKQSNGTVNGGSSSLTFKSFNQSGGTFNSTSGTLTIQLTDGDSADLFIQTAGTFNHNSGTILFNADIGSSSDLNINVNSSVTFNNATFQYASSNGSSPRYTIATGDTLIVLGNFRMQRSGGVGGIILNGGTVEARANIYATVGANGGTTVLKLNGTGDQYYTSSSGGSFPFLEIDKSSGNVTPDTGVTEITVSKFTLTTGNFTAPTGIMHVLLNDQMGHLDVFNVASGTTFTHNSGTLKFQSHANSSVTYTIDVPTTLTVNSVILTVGSVGGVGHGYATGSGDTLVLNGDLTVDTSKVGMYGTWEIKGNITYTSIGGGTAAINLTGSNAQTITHTAGTLPSGLLTINKTNNSDTVTLAANMVMAGALTVTKGVFSQGASYNLTTTGTLTVGANGTFSNVGTGDLTLGGDVSNSGIIILNSNNGSQCTNGADDILLDSSVDNTLRTWTNSGTITIYNVSIDDMTSGTAITVYNSTISGDTVNFTNGSCGITISGTVYSDEGSTVITTGPTVRVKVNGAGSYSAVANGSGVYSVSSITIASAGDVITVYLDGASEDAVAVTRAVDTSSNISTFNLYQNRIILRHEDAGPITNANLGQYDADDDADITFTSNAGALNVTAGKILVWADKIFTPGGSVTTVSSSSQASTDGDVASQSGSGYIDMGSGNAMSVGGDLTGTVTGIGWTATFTGTGSGYTATCTEYHNVVFNGSGGSWNLGCGGGYANLGGSLTITAGSVTLDSNFSMISTSGKVAISASGTLNLSSYELILYATGTGVSRPIVNNGTFNAGTGKISHYANAAIDIETTNISYYDLTLGNAVTLSASRNYTANGALTVTNNLVLNPSAAATSKTLTLLLGGTTTVGGSVTINGTGTAAAAIDTTGSNYAFTAGSINIATGDSFTANGSTITLTGSGTPFTVSGTWNYNTSTLVYSGTSATNITSEFYNALTLQAASGSPTYTLAGSITVLGAFNITTGTFSQGASYDLVASGQVTVGASGVWSNIGTGDITLGTGVSNSGSIILNSNNGSQCTDGADDIVIDSTVDNTTRSWSGAGTFTLYNLNVDDMTGTVTAYKSTLSGDTTWTVGSCGITISGTIYSDEGSTVLTTTPTVRIKVNGAGSYSVAANGSGVYSVSDVTISSAGDVITVYLDGASEDAVAVTRAADTSSNISTFNLYQNRIILRHEDAGPITNTNLGQYDADDDADITFTSNSNNLSVTAGKLIVWTGKTFTPGGTVTTVASSSQASTDGDILIQSSGTMSLGTNAASIGGDFTITGTYSVSSGQTTTFTGTGSSYVINPATWRNVIFNGSGGSWTFGSSNFNVHETLTITAGSVTLGGNPTLQSLGKLVIGASGIFNLGSNTLSINSYGTAGDRPITNSGTFNANTGIVVYKGLGDTTIETTNVSYYNLTLGNSTNLDASYTYSANGVLTVTNNLTVNPLGFSGEVLTLALGGALNVTGTISLTGTTSGVGKLDTTGSNYAVTAGSISIGSLGSLTANGSTITLSGSSTPLTVTGTFTAGTSTVVYTGTSATNIAPTTYATLTLDAASGTPTYSLTGNTVVNTALNITDGTLSQGASYNLTSGAVTVGASGVWSNIGTGDITLSGNVSNAGTITIASNNDTSSCSGTDDIVITSSSGGVQRTWSGAGTFTIWNVDVSDQAGSVTANGSTNTSNNGWTFVGCGITVSGTIYGTDESTAITTGPTLKLSVNGAANQSTTANGSGVFSFSVGTAPSASDIITLWIDGATEDGTLVFRYGTSCTGNPNCTGLSIYRDMVILDSKDGSAITNANLSGCDNDTGTGCADAEIGFTSNSGTLTVSTGRTLRLKDATASFAPGGAVTADYFKQSAGTASGGSATWTINGTLTLTGGTFTSTSGNLDLVGNNGTTLALSGGTFTHNSGTIRSIGNEQTINTGSAVLNNLTVANTNNDSGIYFTGTIDVNGNLTITSGTAWSGGTITVAGNVVTTATTTYGTTIISFDGTGAQSLSASGGSGRIPNIKVDKSSGTLTISDTINVAGSNSTVFNYVQGTMDPTTSTVNFVGDGMTITAGTGNLFNNVGIANGNPVSSTTITGTINANGNVAISSGNQGGGTIDLKGNLTLGANLYGSDSAIIFSGANAQTITQAANAVGGGGHVGTITINKTNNSDTVTLASNTTLPGAITVTKGVFSQGATYNLTTGSTVTVSANGTWENIGTGDITLGGNVSNSGIITIKANNSTTCADANDIVIATSDGSTQRTWSGAGTFTIYNVSVSYQTGSVTAYGSTDGGNNGWTFAGCGITISGTVYQNDGTTALTTGPTVRVKVNGAGSYSAAANGSGVYSITDIAVSATNDVITVYLDGATEKAVTITKAKDSSTNITDLYLYQNRVTFRVETGASALTNTDFDAYDSESDADIQFTVTAGNLTIADGSMLYGFDNATTTTTFIPGGTITTSPSNDGTDSVLDGDFVLQTGANVSMQANALSIGGDLSATSSTLGTSSGQTTTFTATATGHTISGFSVKNIVFNGTGGGWTTTSSLNPSGTITVTAGTWTLGSSVTIGSSSQLTIGAAGTLTMTSATLTITKTGTGGSRPFINNGTFNAGTGSVTYDGASADVTIETTNITYYNLYLTPFISGARGYSTNGALSVTNDFAISPIASPSVLNLALTLGGNVNVGGTTSVAGQFSGTSSIDTTASNYSFTTGKLQIGAGTFTANGSTITLTASGSNVFTNSGTWTPGTSTVNYTGTSATDILAATYNNLSFTPSSPATYTLPSGNITLRGDFTVGSNTSITKGSGTMIFAKGATQTWTDNTSAKQDIGAVQISANSTATTVNLATDVKASSLTIDASQFFVPNGAYTLDLTGSSTPFTISGTFTPGIGTVKYTGATPTVTATTYNNLTLGGTGTYTLPASDITLRGDLEVTTGATVTKSASNKIVFAKGGGGTQTLTANATNSNLGIVQVSSNSGNTTLNVPNDTKMTSLTIDSSQTVNITGSAKTLTLTGGSSPLTISGTLTDTDDTIAFAPSSAGTITIPNRTYYGLTVNGTESTFSPSSTSFSVTDTLNVAAGTLDLNTNDPAVTVKNLTIAGTLSASSAGTLTVTNAFTNNGTFTHNSGSVTIAPAVFSVTLGGTANTHSFYDLNASAGNKQILFESGDTFGVAGTLNLSGEAGKDLLNLNSTDGSTQWLLNLTGSAHASMGFIVVRNGGCYESNGVGPKGNIYNGGGNSSCWRFLHFGGGGTGTSDGSGPGGSGASGGASGGGGGSGSSGGESGGSTSLPQTFTAANGTALTTYNSNWSLITGNFSIQTNAVYANNSNGYSLAAWGGTFSNDQFAEVTYVGSNGVPIGVAVRIQGAAASAYYAMVSNEESSVAEITNGVASNSVAGPAFSIGDVLRLEAVGNSIIMKKNGVVVASFTDSSFSSGSPGLIGYQNFALGRVDDFNAGAASGGGGGGGSSP